MVVKVTLLPSSLGEREKVPLQFLTSFLINDTLALDCGSLGFVLAPDAQARVTDILISHSHIDHLASLPLFLETVFGQGSDPVTVHASPTVLDCLQTDLFNERLWPDFLHITVKGRPFVRVKALAPLATVEIAGLRITPVPVEHAVPTFGFLVADDHATVVFSSDTCATEEIWRQANGRTNVKGVFMEVSFPNELAGLATVSKHHTPASFARETRKLAEKVPFYAYHLKPRYIEQLAGELQALQIPAVEIVQPGKAYWF
jgi:ribonuclease BN (tRNA processing enzyme)